MRKISFILLGMLFTLFISCSEVEKEVVAQTTGVLKVISVKSVNPKMCTYRIESKDISNTGYFDIECECEKFNANTRLELVEIDEKTVDLKHRYYFIDKDNNISVVNTNETKEDVTKAIKNIQVENSNNSLKVKEQKIIIERYKAQVDSLTKLIK
jgi:hypothetical protein